MDFMDALTALASKCRNQGKNLQTEEATKNALIMPFIHLLGYDVFNPMEVVPEFTADIGEKKGERVDYAIMRDNQPIILFECKPYGSPLECTQCTQLQRYFHGTSARVAILTDGNRYRFFSDLEAPNLMDNKPYMDFVLEGMDEALVPEIRKLCKDKFDVDEALSAASELKYTREFKSVLARQTTEPDEDFVKFFIAQVYEGKITQSVKERFTPILTRAIEQFINEQINARLKNALSAAPRPTPEPSETSENAEQDSADEGKPGIVTTEEEWQGYYLVKSMLIGTVAPERVVIRDALKYCAILLDDNNRKPLCRLHFNGKQKYVGLFNDGKKDEKQPIEKLDDMLRFAEAIRATALGYDALKKQPDEA